MTRAFLFWLVFILAVLGYLGLIFWPEGPTWRHNVTPLVEFVLIGLLGWATFGPAIKD